MTNKEVFVLRYRRAIDRIGGAPGLLGLPSSMKKQLEQTTDLVKKVMLLEKIADIKEGRNRA